MTEYSIRVDYGEATLNKDGKERVGNKQLMAMTGEIVFVMYHLTRKLSSKAAVIKLGDKRVDVDEVLIHIREVNDLNHVGATTYLEGDLASNHQFGVTIQVADL